MGERESVRGRRLRGRSEKGMRGRGRVLGEEEEGRTERKRKRDRWEGMRGRGRVLGGRRREDGEEERKGGEKDLYVGEIE